MNLDSVLIQNASQETYRRLKQVSELSNSLGLEPYLVGGVVRDLLMSFQLKQDLDLTVCGGDVLPLARKLAAEWKGKLLAYPQFNTFTIEFEDGTHFDLVTARKETYPEAAALPVVEKGTLQDDLLRRDFAANAIALSLVSSGWAELVDPLKGWEDIRQKKIRILHDRSFQDDPTRIFRAARFAGRLSFELEENTRKLLDESVRRRDIEKLSLDRIRTELEKILQEENPAPILSLLSSWNTLEQIDPRLHWSAAIAQLLGTKVTGTELTGTELVRMSLWLSENSLAEAEEIVQRLNFQKSDREKILEPIRLCQALMTDEPIVSLPMEIQPETTLFFEVLLEYGGQLKKRWLEFVKWTQSRPKINGQTLIELGYKAGPVFRQIFQAVAREKFRGKLKTKPQEIRFVIDNFRREL